jgi:hypothetical protein
MKMPNKVKGPRITFFIKEGTETILVKQMPLLTPDQIKQRDLKRESEQRKSRKRGKKAA